MDMSRPLACFGTLAPQDPTSCALCKMKGACVITNYHNQKEKNVYVAKTEPGVINPDIFGPGPIVKEGTIVLDQDLMRPDGPILLEQGNAPANQRQVAGDHYKTMGVQPWDVVDTWPLEQQIGAYRHGALKYLMRMGSKDERLQEIEKGIHYLEKLAEVLRTVKGEPV
jgi:hypothetical protein